MIGQDHPDIEYWRRKIDGVVARLPFLPIDMVGATMEPAWQREIGEPVELLVVHRCAGFYPDPVAAGYVAWCDGYWTGFNRGGWVWDGLAGTVAFVRPLDREPGDQRRRSSS